MSNEVADNTSIINIHARPICVKDSCNTYFYVERNIENSVKLQRKISTSYNKEQQTTMKKRRAEITYSMLPMIIKHQSFSHTFPLIIATTKLARGYLLKMNKINYKWITAYSFHGIYWQCFVFMKREIICRANFWFCRFCFSLHI